MFGLSIGEVVVILVIALLVLGPTKLPEVAKQLGKGMRELRRAAVDLQRAFHDAAGADEVKPAPPKTPAWPAPTRTVRSPNLPLGDIPPTSVPPAATPPTRPAAAAPAPAPPAPTTTAPAESPTPPRGDVAVRPPKSEEPSS